MIRRFGFDTMVVGRRSLGLAIVLLLAGLAVGYGLMAAQTAGIEVDGARRIEPPRSDMLGAARAKTPVAFPLRVKPGQRYLEDAAGRPFLIHGDTGWGLITQLTREDVDRYLRDRRARGFNTLLVMLLATPEFANAPANAYGHLPFTVPGDYSTPNEAYFAHADWVLRQAAERGFLVLLAPSYVGAVEHEGSVGWYSVMVENGPLRLREYGEYLGQRYRDFTNILWVHGGDDNPPRRDLIRAIAAGIRKFSPRALHTVEGAPDTAALGYWQGERWLQVNTFYSVSEAIYQMALEQYDRPGRMPFFLIESAYENAEVYEATERHIRTQAYHALLSGAAGQVFGNNPIWHFNGRQHGVASILRDVARAVLGESGTAGRIIDGREPGLMEIIASLIEPGTWQEALDSHGAQSMTQIHDLLTAFPWWLLEPDRDNLLLTAGVRSGFERAVAARASDRSFAILYLPSSREISVDLRQLAGPSIAAHWYDPADGLSHVAGGPFPASGSRRFTPKPVNNSSGFDDWVLVLQSLPAESAERGLETTAQPLEQKT